MSDTQNALPRELHDVLLDSIEPAELTPDREQAMKGRLLKRVAASVGVPGVDAAGLITIRSGEGDWQPLMPRVHMKVLLREGNTLSYLLRLEPGAKIPGHAHPQTEECLVLDGEARIGDLVVRAGDYHAAPKGRPHGVFESEKGALVFLRGEAPAARHLRLSDPRSLSALAVNAVRELAGERPRAP